MIVIVNYGMGNLRSVQKAFQRLLVPIVITDDFKVIEKADKLVLPGVGHFANGMEKLKERHLDSLLTHMVKDKKIPILGICLGMQLMTTYSEEGETTGLGWLPGRIARFNFDSVPHETRLKIPHMGWNNLDYFMDHPLMTSISPEDLFYFVHSYHYEGDMKYKLCLTHYGYTFASGLHYENIMGIQFHPEKSYKSGLKLIENFSKL